MTIKQGWIQLLMVSSVLMLSSTSARAQITPDNTLGTEGSRLTPNVKIQGASADHISGGAQRGSNLFHSFSKFNVGDGQRVYFANPSGIQNILTRVTGKEASNILGTLGVDGIANLFLLNPNGILFGPNAQLDVGGSFVGTTANAIRFGEQGFFSATTPEAPTLLTVNPSALLFNQLNQGSIVSRSLVPAGTSPTGRDLFGLRVPNGQSLLLVGGDVQIGGGGSSAGLIAQGGLIELGGLSTTGEIGLDTTGNSFQLTYPFDVARSNVSLINNARVSVRGNGGGNVAVNANAFTATNGGRLIAGTEGRGNAGDIIVNASTVNFAGTASDGGIAGLFNEVSDNATGNGGNVTLNTNSLNASSGAQIDSSTLGRGNAGNVIINAHDTVALVEDALIFSSTFGRGNAGNIILNTNSLNASSGAQIDSSTLGRGNAGNVIINARDTVALEDAAIFSDVEKDALGQGGDIRITTGSLSLTNSAQMNASTSGRGDAGDVIINARNITFQDGFSNSNGKIIPSVFNGVGTGAIGNAGDVRISTNSLSILNNASISNNTRGQGKAGNVFIDASDHVSLTRGAISSSILQDGVEQGGTIQIRTELLSLADFSFISSSNDGQGDAGSILIDAGSLSMTRSDPSLLYSGYITTNTTRQGNAGNVTINVRDTISIDKGVISSNVSDTGSDDSGFVGEGQGGDIRITTGSLQLTNGSQLVAASTGQGDAGNIVINARDTVSVDSDSSVGADVGSSNGSTAIGRAGNIQITARSLFLTDGGTLGSATGGQGNAGNIDIQATDQVVLDSGSNNRITRIVSSVLPDGVGRGGDIQITTGSLSLTNNAVLLAGTAGQGRAGDITIKAGDNISLLGTSPDGQFRSVISTETDSTSTGDAGNITLDTGQLDIRDGASILANTFGQGQAGNITIHANDRVSLSGVSADGRLRSAVSTETAQDSTGKAGDITITTPDFQVANGGIVLASTFNDSRAGDIALNAQTFTATTGGQVVTNTLGAGDAGTIRLNVSDAITLSGSDPNFAARGDRAQSYITRQEQGALLTDVFLSQGAASGLFANTAPGSTGKGGSIIIDPRTFRIQDGARISVGSLGSGQGGSIQVQAGSLLLNRGQISAETASTNGGDITLQVEQTLLLRNGSLISTTAGTEQAGGNGGNITINANNGFLVAFPSENSDISANAYSGNGGNVQINAQGIFGIQARPQLTSQSDITASSELGGIQGQVTIIQPDVQPTQGLIELPTDVLDASSQIAQVCPRGTANHPLGKFIVSGRGSLTPNPIEPLASTSNLSPLATLKGNSAANLPRDDRSSTSNNSLPVSSPAQIVEATGWIKTPNGKIELVTHVPEATSYAATAAAACPVTKQGEKS